LISQILEDQGRLRVLIDAELSGFIPDEIFARLPVLFRHYIAKLEFNVWCIINKINKEKIERVSFKHLSGRDTVFAFSYKAACGNFRRRCSYLKRCRAVIFHLSHYFIATQEKSENLKQLPNVFLAGDADITQNYYFQKYFSWYKNPFLILPFSVSARFSCRIPYFERDERCIATGSFHELARERPRHKYIDFIRSTGLDTYHPLRKAIFDAKLRLANRIVCYVSPYRNYGHGSFVRRQMSRFTVSQKEYFAVDIVSLYNRHRFAVVGEEFSGFPALGALEAMACGAVMIGDPRCFEGLDITAGIHFIPYNGTLSGLLDALSSVSDDEARTLSERGCCQVATYFSSKAVYARWRAELSKVGLS
jgi:glycosyltransferase involved in cell wall biosynthesis